MKDFKERYFAQYWGQEVATINPFVTPFKMTSGTIADNVSHIALTPLSKITDEHAIEVAKLAHQSQSDNWKVVRRDKDILHVEWRNEKYGETRHISIMPQYATVNANHSFDKSVNDKYESFKVNIGEIHLSSKYPIPYIAIVDYLRSKGYALPFLGKSVEELIEMGVLKLKEI